MADKTLSDADGDDAGELALSSSDAPAGSSAPGSAPPGWSGASAIFPNNVAAPADYGATLADVGVSSKQTKSGVTRSAYQVVKTISKGGMGSLSLARDNRTRRWVAIKRPKDDLARDAKACARFLEEAQAIAALSHFHIVALYTADEDAAGPYMAMEWIAGPAKSQNQPLAGWNSDWPNPAMDLDEFVKNNGPMHVEQAAELGMKLCSALQYAHGKGIVHRDVKPANVLLTEEMEPKLSDFGLAKRNVREAQENEQMTLAGAKLLTPYYGAPEQEQDGSKVDHRADIYALGATLWFALTGESPRMFRETEVPDQLRSPLVKALKKDREQRFGSAKEFMEALKRAMDPLARKSAAGPAVEARNNVAGTCGRCGHVNALDPNQANARKFCERCGSPLIERCLGCEAENGSWAIFCGSCGADLAAQVTEARNAQERNKSAIAEALETSDFAKAVTLLEAMSQINLPRLAEYQNWARGELARVLPVQAAAIVQRDAVLAEALQRMAAHDYNGVGTLLMQIPQPLWDGNVRKLLGSSRELLQETITLRQQIKEMVTAHTVLGVRPLLERYLQLNPSDPNAPALLQQAIARERREHEKGWQQAQDAATISAYEEFLKIWPEGAHVADAEAKLAPMLRDILRDDPDRPKMRERYLKIRTAALHAMDQKSWKQGMAAAYCIYGLIGGCIGGFIIGAVFGVGGGILGGMLGGAVAAGVLADRK